MKCAWLMGPMIVATGCAMPNPNFDGQAEDADAETEQGDGDGDPDASGDGDGDPSTGDGDGDPDTGDGDPDSSTDTDTGDGDPDTGDGDGDTEPVCPAESPDLCFEECVDKLSDASHCGTCGNTCEGGCTEGKCQRKRIMFATSELFSGNLGSLLGADDICYFAGIEFYPESDFVAWNSSLQVSPQSSLPKDGFFVRTDGQVIAMDWTDLTDGELAVPISYNEKGAAIPSAGECATSSQAWTGTLADGHSAPGTKCIEWTSVSNLQTGTFGLIHATDTWWSLAAPDCPEPARCSQLRRIYCIVF